MILGSLFPQADFSQLPKVVYAFKHFQEHRKQEAAAGRTVSFWKFAEMHFFNPNEHSAGHEQQHSQLPLQSFQSAIAIAEFFHQSFPEFNLIKNTQAILLTNQSLDLPGFLSNIFRPPLG
ncbi:MAG: hypothetical protein ACK4TA_09485 [Saprospiraceae bacterium]